MAAVEVAARERLSSGNSVGQGAKLYAQRGWKGQPLGTETSDGGVPSIATSWLRRTSIVGIERRSPQVYGCWGAVKISLAGPYSISRPAYITSTVSAVSAMGRVVRDEDHAHVELLLDPLDELEDLRLHRDVERSRRLIGYQHRRSVHERHRDHRALAHAPGNWCAKSRARSSGCGMPTARSNATACLPASCFETLE